MSKDETTLRLPFDFETLKKNPEHYSEVSFREGEKIFKQGTPLTHIVILKKGILKVHFEYMGKQLSLLLIRPGQMVGGPGFLTDFKHHFSLSAMENVIVGMLNTDIYLQQIQKNPGFDVDVVRYLNQVHIITYRRLLSLTLKSMYGRVADTLLYLVDEFYHSSVFDTTLTRQDLADFSALSMESVVRILTAFVRDKLIVCEGKHFEILDRDRLQRMQ